MKLIFAIIAMMTQIASAQVLDSSFYGWKLYEYFENSTKEKKCYMLASPVKSDSTHSIRQKPYLMITRYQARRIEEVSVFSGFEYKLNGSIFLSIDDNKFEMPTNGEMAFAKNKYDDLFLIQNMLDSATVKVRADSAIGTYSIDEYSLKGVARTYQRMRQICK